MRLRRFTWRESNNCEAFRELSHETEPAFCSLTERCASSGNLLAFGASLADCVGVPGGKSKDVEA
jgi:hypothetical protein